ncbi:hypothetical protein [Streptomyces sp. UH6]|uniref:hypothetical protein n=1 Tax=Streptomyces sp. UH6 TaxID=2748379 RepID=UPI0015D4729B|nr:hypothetical protein [Streptomyces sp. UH6]NYV77156.1 hypothetical protein [Streptomyces sp. UH6]
MFVLVLGGLLLLVLGGCGCVYWAARGDAPRWARGVARVTLLGSELAGSASRASRPRRDGGEE